MTSRPDANEAAARELIELANEDPAAALPRAHRLLDRAARDGLDRLAAIAGRAAGLAEAYVGDLSVSLTYLDDATAAAARTGDAELEGEVEMTAGAVRAWAGDGAGGVRSLDRAIAMLTGSKRARALVQRGSVMYRAARFAEALENLADAEPALRESGDEMWLAHLLNNRGLAIAHQGSLHAAEQAIEQARDLYAGLGHRFSVAQMIHNLGWVAARLGDVPCALERFDEAEVLYTELGSQPAELYRDRSSALISVHLVDEAYTSAMRAAALLDRDRHAAGYAEALARAADAALLADRFDEAKDAAGLAEHAFTDQGRHTWARYAELVGLRALERQGGTGPNSWERACDIAAELEQSGYESGSVAARVLAAELALDAGDLDAAAAEIDKAGDVHRTGTIDLRVEAWLVTARLRIAAGQATSAQRAVDAGLRLVEHHQSVQGSTETRAHAAGHAKRIADLGVGLAWQSGRPRQILRWFERTRAGALRYPPVRVPDDTALAADLARLRRVEQEMRSGNTDPEHELGLARERRQIEQDIMRRTRRAAGQLRVEGSFDVTTLLDRLGDRALIEYGHVDGRVVLVTAADGVVRRHEGPPVSAVLEANDMLRFGLSRLAAAHGSDASLAAARTTVTDAAASLSRLLLEPLPIGDRELVVVPPAALHALAWGLLPAAVGRPLSVSPSAELWVRRAGSVALDAPVLLSGPRLPNAPAEIAAIHGVWPGAATFDDGSGSVDAVRSALETTTMAHLACHGRFRAENPLFSALEFADGWFNVYDFESLASVPDLMILSACDAGLSAERPGDEVMGIVAGLLGAGTRSVVASIGLVPDAAGTRTVMTDFHRRIAAGARVSEALATAQAEAVATGDLASASFVCFGHS